MAADQITYRAHIDITDRNRVFLAHETIEEMTSRRALERQAEIYAKAKAEYGNENIYIFTNWIGLAPSSHLPRSPASLDVKPHKPFPEERGERDQPTRTNYRRTTT
jgi:hypothetical protein